MTSIIKGAPRTIANDIHTPQIRATVNTLPPISPALGASSFLSRDINGNIAVSNKTGIVSAT